MAKLGFLGSSQTGPRTKAAAAATATLMVVVRAPGGTPGGQVRRVLLTGMQPGSRSHQIVD